MLFRPRIPQINFAHPACNNLQFLWAANGGLSAFDLMKRTRGTASGTVATAHDAILGPVLKFRSLQADGYSFAARQSTVSTLATIAFIGIINGNGGSSRTFFQNSTAANGIALTNQSSGTIQMIARNVGNQLPTLSISTGVPYLIVFSTTPNSFATNAMSVRLDTGVIVTASGTNVAGPAAGNGSFLLGNLDLLGQSCDADLAACLFSNTFLGLGMMRKWALDPWGPWRIPEFDAALLNFAIPASGAAQSFVSVM